MRSWLLLFLVVSLFPSEGMDGAVVSEEREEEVEGEGEGEGEEGREEKGVGLSSRGTAGVGSGDCVSWVSPKHSPFFSLSWVGGTLSSLDWKMISSRSSGVFEVTYLAVLFALTGVVSGELSWLTAFFSAVLGLIRGLLGFDGQALPYVKWPVLPQW